MFKQAALTVGWLLCSCLGNFLFAQQKTLPAIKTNQAPRIDGVLNDPVWQLSSPATDFIQNFPEVGAPASQKTVVRVLYSDRAIYIGAYLYDDPALIRRQITARDEEQQKDLDYFAVFLDTYNDHQNGFQFLATSANVQSDARLAPNVTVGFGNYGDKTWDAVWDSKVSIQPDGWIVEMEIPYISLRFSKAEVQNWGIQFLRSVRRTNETSYWNFVDPNVNGFVNQFGLLQNLVDIKPPLRLSFSPYVSTGYRKVPESNGFRNEWLKSGGMDVKYGINESFTLDATLVPDFGQVISDNVINNLTPYEVQFDEYRPFFTEGTEIFNKSGLFYSRRIGATPSGYYAVEALAESDPDVEVVRNPGRTQLYNAIKLSGRTPKKLGIGIFNAVGAPMYASIRNKSTGERSRINTEVLTNYNIIVLDQALKGRSYLTFTNTNVLRQGSADDANVSGLDFSFYDRKNNFNLRGLFHYSRVFSDNDYDGYQTSLRAGKVSGKWQYYVQNQLRSANFDPTDLGYLQTANQNVTNAQISYNDFTPGKHFLNYNVRFNLAYRRLFDPNVFNEAVFELSTFLYFRNFWDLSVDLGYLPDQHDYFVLGRPFVKYARRPQYGYLAINGSTDSRKRLYVSWEAIVADFFKNPEKKYYELGGGLRYRFSNKLTAELSHNYGTETDYIINAGRDNLGEPRIAFVDFREVTSIFSAIYNFTPRINLTLRVRHYWSNVDIKRRAYLNASGLPVLESPVTAVDNVNYFNTDAFFTWDFRYGSRLILGYKNWLGDDQVGVVDGVKHRRYLNNFGQTFNLRHGAELTVRFIYFLDYNQLRKKR
jgi:hypothetical protein